MLVESLPKRAMLLAVASLLVALFLCQLYGVHVMRQNVMFRQSGMPQVSDLAVAVPVAFALVALRYELVNAFQAIAVVVLPPGKRESRFRVRRFSTSLFCFLYFSGIITVGLGLFVGEPWFPVSLGGSGDVVTSIAMYSEPPSMALKGYLLMELSYQLHSCVFVLLLKPFDRDTIEFVIHDLLAMMLITTSYLTNYIATGVIVAFINDASDVAEYAFLLATDSCRKGLIAVLLAALVVSWSYLRLVIFPRECLYNYIVVLHQANPDVSVLFLYPLNLMLTLLMLLHGYWLALFVQKGLNSLRQTSARCNTEATSMIRAK